MLASESDVRVHSHNPQSTTKIGGTLLLGIALAAFVVFVFAAAPLAHGSNPLPLGSLQLNLRAVRCAPEDGWYSYTNPNNQQTYNLNCFTAVVTCPNTQAIALTFGYLNPVGIVPNAPSQANGVIVIHPPGTGTTPPDDGLPGKYFTNGYEIVELAWANAWEQTYDPFQPGNVPSIQNAACRPATFLNYVYSNPDNIFPNVLGINPNAGMCAQGVSAGSGAIAYSMAYYGAGTYLDNVELISGPVFGDIEQGCIEPPPTNNVTVCGQTNYMGHQYGCQLGTGGSTWTLSPTYIQGAQGGVSTWTNTVSPNPSCAGNMNTLPAKNAAWLAQSIVDQSTGGTGQGAIPVFNYSTGISAWLCRSLANGTANNSSPQGQIFYANIGFNNQPPHYDVYAVDGCVGPEGVSSGNVPGFYPQDFTCGSQPGACGGNAITYDMVGYTSQNPPVTIPAQCVRRLH
jgi:hypothetical protein